MVQYNFEVNLQTGVLIESSPFTFYSVDIEYQFGHFTHDAPWRSISRQLASLP